MTSLKNTLALTLVLAGLSLVGCSEAQKDGTQESKDEAVSEMSKVTDKASDMTDATKEKAGEMVDSVAEEATDLKEAISEESEELMDALSKESEEMQAAGKEKLKQACIEMKKKTGGDESEC